MTYKHPVLNGLLNGLRVWVDFGVLENSTLNLTYATVSQNHSIVFYRSRFKSFGSVSSVEIIHRKDETGL